MSAELHHLAPGIRKVVDAFEADDLAAIEPAFGDAGIEILERWWRGEELGVVHLAGDIWSPAGVLGEEPILRQAGCAEFHEGARVLDIACGIGGPGRILARHFQCCVHGVDLDGDAALVARGLSTLERLGHLTAFFAGDRVSLPVACESYDLVWGHGGWGFGDDLIKTWAGAFRVLRGGGQVCCTAFRDTVAYAKELGFTDVRFHDYYGHMRRKTLELFLDAMQEQRQRIVAQSGQQTWDMFYNQKTRQLAELDDHQRVLVARKPVKG